MLKLLKIRILIALAAMFTLAGCSDDTLGTEPIEGEEMSGDVYLRIQMNLGDGAPTMGRAGETGGDTGVNETPGTTNENAIKSVDILVYDIDENMLVNRIPLDDQQISQIQANNEVVVPIYAQQGHRVKIYAAVNMTDEMRRQFTFGKPGTDFAISTGQTTYQDVINQFVPGSNGMQESVNCIPMTGQFKIADKDFNIIDQADNDVITITKQHTSRDNPMNIKAELTRIVAKVHVLARMDEGGDSRTYVKAAKPSDSGKRFGWVRLAEVRYIPNGINKSTHIFPQYENGRPKDLNMDLDCYLAEEKINAQLWGTDYIFLDGNKIHEMNFGSQMATAEPYDETRFQNTKGGTDVTNRYVKGMYCPENYFDLPSNQTLFDEYEEAIPMITHVTIAARMIPCVILVENDYVEKMDKFVLAYDNDKESFLKTYVLTEDDFTPADKDRWATIKKDYFTTTTSNHGFIEISSDKEDDIRYILNCSLKFNKLWSSDPSDYNDDKFSDGTFYVFDQIYEGDGYTGDRYLCLTAGAVSSDKKNTHIKSRSVPHIGGWGYYYTYIDNDGSTTNGKTPYAASQVTRNTYYIITVGNFGYPGGSITSPEFIKVNTERVDWNYAGRADVNLH